MFAGLLKAKATLVVLLCLLSSGSNVLANEEIPGVARSAEQWLSAAREDLASLHYETAQRDLKWALQTGAADRLVVRDIFRLLAETSAALNDDAGAESAFANLLSLDRSFSLPPGTSPKIEDPFGRAKAWSADKPPLNLRRWAEFNKVIVELEADPTHLVSAVRVTYLDEHGAARAMLSGPSKWNRFIFLLPQGSVATAKAAALDRYGNVMVESINEASTSDVAAAIPQVEERTLLSSPWLYGGAAAASAVVAVGFGLKAHNQRSDLAQCDRDPLLCFPETYVQTDAIATRNEKVAWGSLGATAIFSTIAAWLALRTPPGAATSEAVGLVVTPTGLAGRF